MIHAYLTKPPYLAEVLHEVGGEAFDERLVLSPKLSHPAFAIDVWPNSEIIEFSSINDAIKKLKAKSLRWFYYKSKHVRRGALIADGLKQVRDNAKPFAIFTLLNEQQLLVCTQPWKKWPCGEPHFIENKLIPPNRAYLKLWEALDLMAKQPKHGEFCIDLGAAPGGWTWVLAETGANVLAIDKSLLDPKIAAMPNVTFKVESAFALDPKLFDQVDWLCSDVICYPERALTLIQKWLASGKAKQMVVTIKLQGETNWPVIKALQAIPNGCLTHLWQNKHELTFLYPFDVVKS